MSRGILLVVSKGDYFFLLWFQFLYLEKKESIFYTIYTWTGLMQINIFQLQLYANPGISVWGGKCLICHSFLFLQEYKEYLFFFTFLVVGNLFHVGYNTMRTWTGSKIHIRDGRAEPALEVSCIVTELSEILALFSYRSEIINRLNSKVAINL